MFLLVHGRKIYSYACVISLLDNCYRWTIGSIFLSTLKLLFWKSHVPLTFSSISVFEFHFYSVYCMQRMSTFGCMFIIMTLTVLEFFKTKNNIQFFFSTWRRNIIYQHSGATVPELFKWFKINLHLYRVSAR